ncbi:hypothetical protein A6R68_09350, partial [Neotoma lepida]
MAVWNDSRSCNLVELLSLDMNSSCAWRLFGEESMNEYLYLFLVGAVEIPAYVFMCIWLKRVGRRNTVVSCLSLASLLCVVYVAMPL